MTYEKSDCGIYNVQELQKPVEETSKRRDLESRGGGKTSVRGDDGSMSKETQMKKWELVQETSRYKFVGWWMVCRRNLQGVVT